MHDLLNSTGKVQAPTSMAERSWRGIRASGHLCLLVVLSDPSSSAAATGNFRDGSVFGGSTLAASNITAFSPVFGNAFPTNEVWAPNPVSVAIPPAAASLPPELPASENFPLNHPVRAILNDTNALYFLSLAGISDNSARNDMMLAVADCKAAGLWTNLVDLFAFEPRYHPERQRSFFGRPWTFDNPVWNGRGAGDLRATNFMRYPLPDGLTNYTLCIFYQQDAAGLDNCDATVANNDLAELRSSADGSCTLLTSWGVWGGTRVWTSMGTNFTYWCDHINAGSNMVNTLLSGSIRGDSSVAPLTPSLYCVGYDNGTVSASVNGNPAFWGQVGHVTDSLKIPPNSSPVDEMILGGGDTNWLNLGCSNAYGATIINAIVFDCPLSPEVSACAMRMATDLEPFNEAVEFAGSSMLNDQEAANSGRIGTPLTNGLALIDQRENPGRLVFQSAAPGSLLRDWEHCYGTVPATGYIPVLTYLSPAKYRVRRFITDGPRNDALIGIPGAYSVTRFNRFCRPLLSDGISVELIQTPWCYGNSAAANANWQATCQAIRSDFPLSKFYPFADLVSSNILAAASQDDPPVHPNAKNVAGYLFNAAMDDVVNGRPADFFNTKMKCPSRLPCVTVASDGRLRATSYLT